ncbi:MAG: hypothetical protein CVV46_02870 [Spirochaetae bacterium HGW-Spirochaetae-2]|jgi:hypothetical protein|nr:MAG: hypothetical protein CVV46_02870 [Spirochaetae bacterium HGW-Spirochaetae-2]
MDYVELLGQSNPENPIRKAFENKTEYYSDFLKTITVLQKYLTTAQMNSLLRQKLQLGKQSFNENSYYEAATEVSVIAKFASIPFSTFLYETPTIVGTKKNPECTIVSEGVTINVEAKCPNLDNLIPFSNSEKTLVFDTYGRHPDYEELYLDLKRAIEEQNSNVSVLKEKHKDNTLKDFLESAHSKFPEAIDDNTINILVVSLDNYFTFNKWFSYLFGYQGLFLELPFADPANYSRVDAIIFSNLQYRHRNNTSIMNSAWDFDDAFTLFFSNGHRQRLKDAAFNFTLQHIKNYTEEMKQYRESIEYKGFLADVDDMENEFLIPTFIKEHLEKQKNEFYWDFSPQ